jgi:hypothetical protein
MKYKDLFLFLLSDASYFVWGIMFVIYSFLSYSSETPPNFSKVQKILYWDISRMFRQSKNPNSFILSQITFDLYGLSKILFGLVCE